MSRIARIPRIWLIDTDGWRLGGADPAGIISVYPWLRRLDDARHEALGPIEDD